MDKYTETIKVRITAEARRLFQAEAESRGLKFANIIREAMSEFIGSHDLKVKHGKNECRQDDIDHNLELLREGRKEVEFDDGDLAEEKDRQDLITDLRGGL